MAVVLGFTQKCHSTSKHLRHKIQAPAEGVGSTTTTACREGCLVGTTCVYPPTSLSAIAENQPSAASGFFRQNDTKYVRFHAFSYAKSSPKHSQIEELVVVSIKRAFNSQRAEGSSFLSDNTSRLYIIVTTGAE